MALETAETTLQAKLAQAEAQASGAARDWDALAADLANMTRQNEELAGVFVCV